MSVATWMQPHIHQIRLDVAQICIFSNLTYLNPLDHIWPGPHPCSHLASRTIASSARLMSKVSAISYWEYCYPCKCKVCDLAKTHRIWMQTSWLIRWTVIPTNGKIGLMSDEELSVMWRQKQFALIFSVVRYCFVYRACQKQEHFKCLSSINHGK